jgi:diguanylate cyclase (GGDEF)-like protein
MLMPRLPSGHAAVQSRQLETALEMLLNVLSLLEKNADSLCLGALLLALGFRRNRFALAIIVLAVPMYANIGAHPGLLLASALVLGFVAIAPEPPLRSWRAGTAVAMAAILPLLPQWTPGLMHWLDGRALLPMPGIAEFGWGVWVVLAAIVVVLVRWSRRGSPLDLYFALALLPAVVAWSLAPPHSARAWFVVSDAALAMAVLYGAFRMAFIDALTGLPNRRALDERLARSPGKLGVAMVDVDHFKRFNDRYGHESGDRALKAVARQLRRVRGGSAYRYGGEEFAVVFEGRQLERASDVLENLRTGIEETRVRLGRPTAGKRAQAVRKGEHEGEVGVTVSIGLAERTAGNRTATAVVEAADKALYRSKQRGRNRLTLATATRA